VSTGSFLESYSDHDANEHRKQTTCLVSGFAGVPKDEEKDIEGKHNCAGGKGEESTQSSGDIADRQRLSFESVTAVSGPTCASDMAAMLVALDAPVARGMCRLSHVFVSGSVDSAA